VSQVAREAANPSEADHLRGVLPPALGVRIGTAEKLLIHFPSRAGSDLSSLGPMNSNTRKPKDQKTQDDLPKALKISLDVGSEGTV